MTKYVIVSFLHKPIPDEFKSSDWPLHVTIAPRLRTDMHVEDMKEKIKCVCKDAKPMAVMGESRAMFGKRNTVLVTELAHTKELTRFHFDLIESLEPDVELLSPEHCGEQYRPHVTDQKEESLGVNTEVHINSVSLVEMIDGNRKVLETFAFSRQGK